MLEVVCENIYSVGKIRYQKVSIEITNFHVF